MFVVALLVEDRWLSLEKTCPVKEFLFREAALDALAIVFPVNCGGCGEPDRVLCVQCQSGLIPAVRRFELEAPGRAALSTWAGLSYDGPLPAVLHAFKESGRTHLAHALAGPLRAAIITAWHSLSPGEAVTFVSPPSTRQAHRSRGYVPLDVLTQRLNIRTARLLVAAGSRQDQSILGREERWQNLDGSLRVVKESIAGRRIILLDDVATTGATLHECARALTEAGATVLGAVVVAHTERRIPLPLMPEPVAQQGVLVATTSVPSEMSAAMESFGTLSAKLRDR